MTSVAFILVILFAFVASFIQRVTGFGFGIFIMTILPFLMPSYGEATALSGMLALISACVTLFQMKHFLIWKKLLPILITFLVISFFCVNAVGRIDSHNARRILGAVLILVSIYFFLYSNKIKIKPSIPVQLSLGTVSGLMGGFFAMQGPPAVIYFLSSSSSKEQYMALISAYFVIGNGIMTIYRAGNGFVTPVVTKAWLLATPAAIVGILIGSKVYDRIPIGTLRKIVYAYMAAAGVIAIVF